MLMLNDVPDVLRIKDVVSLLQMSESTVKRLMKSGRLPYTKIGRLVYIKKESILKILEENEIDLKAGARYNQLRSKNPPTLKDVFYE